VKFAFIAKHRGIWAVDWICGALGVSRGGFYAWLKRPRSWRSRSNQELGAKVRASFLAGDRTYGARRVWKDLLADGAWCGPHRIERLMCKIACNIGSDSYVERPDRQGVFGGLIQSRRCSHMSSLLMRACDRWP
jgi:hypothetical protein